MSFRDLMNSTVNVQSRTKEPDGRGGFTETWSTVHSSMPCRIVPMSGMERALYGRETVVRTHKLFCNTDYTVNEEDRIVYGSRTFDVILARDIDMMGHHREIELSEVEK